MYKHLTKIPSLDTAEHWTAPHKKLLEDFKVQEKALSHYEYMMFKNTIMSKN